MLSHPSRNRSSKDMDAEITPWLHPICMVRRVKSWKIQQFPRHCDSPDPGQGTQSDCPSRRFLAAGDAAVPAPRVLTREGPNFVEKLLLILKIPVNGREPDVGDLVDR